MATTLIQEIPQPKTMKRAKVWDHEVENYYRFQLAGYRDEVEYSNTKNAEVEKWPESGFVKKLQRKDGYFYYFNKQRECMDKDVNKCKIYQYQ